MTTKPTTFDQVMAETIEEATRHSTTTPPPPALPRWTQIDRASLPDHVQELLQDALWAGCTPTVVAHALLQGTRTALPNQSPLAPEIDRLLAQIGAVHSE